MTPNCVRSGLCPVQPDGRWLVTGSWDGRLSVWDPETAAELKRIEIGAPVQKMALDPDGTRVAVVAGETAGVWDLQSGERIATLAGHPAFSVSFVPDGSQLASLGTEGTIRVLAVDLDDLIEIAEQELTRSLTDEECREYLHVSPCQSDG